jgi:hypothetical protein
MKENDIKKTYDKHIPLLLSKAKKYSVRTGIDFQELFAQANLCYMESWHKYTKTKSRFSYFLQICLESNLKNYIQKELNYINKTEPLKTEIIKEFYFVADKYLENFICTQKVKIIKEKYPMIYDFIFGTPPLWYADEYKTTKLTKAKIIKYLTGEGHKKSYIKKCFKDIEYILYK